MIVRGPEIVPESHLDEFRLHLVPMHRNRLRCALGGSDALDQGHLLALLFSHRVFAGCSAGREIVHVLRGQAKSGNIEGAFTCLPLPMFRGLAGLVFDRSEFAAKRDQSAVDLGQFQQ